MEWRVVRAESGRPGQFKINEQRTRKKQMTSKNIFGNQLGKIFHFTSNSKLNLNEKIYTLKIQINRVLK